MLVVEEDEKIARLRVWLPRSEGRVAGNPPTQRWAIDDAAQRIHFNRKMLTLTPIEFRLLRTLHEDFTDTSERAVDSHIKNLRKKIEAAGADAGSIASVYGAGYRFDVPGD